jgi:hypothetical protein
VRSSTLRASGRASVRAALSCGRDLTALSWKFLANSSSDRGLAGQVGLCPAAVRGPAAVNPLDGPAAAPRSKNSELHVLVVAGRRTQERQAHRTTRRIRGWCSARRATTPIHGSGLFLPCARSLRSGVQCSPFVRACASMATRTRARRRCTHEVVDKSSEADAVRRRRRG